MIKKLESYFDVRKGDFFSVTNPVTNQPFLAKIQHIYPKEGLFYYSGPSFTGSVMGDGLKEVVLLRNTENGLEILAGEYAFSSLNPPKLAPGLLRALARVCLKRVGNDPFSGFDDT